MKIVVNAIILNKEKKFLIIKRKSGIHANLWAFPGGILKKNETLELALKREVKEETNLDIEIKEKISEYTYPRKNNEITKGQCYLAALKSENQDIKINKKEISDFKYVNLEQFEQLEHIEGLENEAMKVLFK